VSRPRERITTGRSDFRWLGIDKDTWTRTDDNSQILVAIRGVRSGVQMPHERYIRRDRHRAAGEAGTDERASAGDRADVHRVAGAGLWKRRAEDSEELRSAWHIYCIKCERRDDLAVHLAGTGSARECIIIRSICTTRVTATPAGAAGGGEAQAKRILSLPMFPDMTDDQVRLVCGRINEFFGGRSGASRGGLKTRFARQGKNT